MQAHNLSLQTPRPVRQGQKVKTFFLNVVMLHIKLKGNKYRPTYKEKTLILHTLLTLGQVERSNIESVQISIFFVELSSKIVDRLLIMICMIPKLNLGVGEMRFMFWDLHVSLK